MGKLAKAKNALTCLSSFLCTAASLTYVELTLEYITRGTRFQSLSLTVSFQLGQINVGVEVFRQERICFCFVHTLQNNVIFVVNGLFQQHGRTTSYISWRWSSDYLSASNSMIIYSDLAVVKYFGRLGAFCIKYYRSLTNPPPPCYCSWPLLTTQYAWISSAQKCSKSLVFQVNPQGTFCFCMGGKWLSTLLRCLIKTLHSIGVLTKLRPTPVMLWSSSTQRVESWHYEDKPLGVILNKRVLWLDKIFCQNVRFRDDFTQFWEHRRGGRGLHT